MNRDFFEKLLENLEDEGSPFPAAINWNLKDLYIKGLEVAFKKTILEKGQYSIGISVSAEKMD